MERIVQAFKAANRDYIITWKWRHQQSTCLLRYDSYFEKSLISSVHTVYRILSPGCDTSSQLLANRTWHYKKINTQIHIFFLFVTNTISWYWMIYLMNPETFYHSCRFCCFRPWQANTLNYTWKVTEIEQIVRFCWSRKQILHSFFIHTHGSINNLWSKFYILWWKAITDKL